MSPPLLPGAGEPGRGLIAVLPNLLTLGNLMAGFFAIASAGGAEWRYGLPVPEYALRWAAAAILIAMVFDLLDGAVARLTGTTSELGAQLDSLADAVTFGVAPGLLIVMAHAPGRYEFTAPFWTRLALVAGALYTCAAVIRLARFNAEQARTDPGVHGHFSGLPSPAAAGVVACAVLVQDMLTGSGPVLDWPPPGIREPLGERVLHALPALALVLGGLMISRLPYAHLGETLRSRKPELILVGCLGLGGLVALLPEWTLLALFLGYALSGPWTALGAWLAASRRQVGAAPKPDSHARERQDSPGA